MSRRQSSTAPSNGWERRAPITLALVTVAAMHWFAWRLMMEAPSRPRAADANAAHTRHRPLIVALLPEARPPTTQPLERDSALSLLVEKQTARTPPAARPPPPRPAAKVGQTSAPSADARANEPSPAPEPAAVGRPIDWQRDLSNVSEPRRFQYTSPAARTAAAAGSSAQQPASAPSESPLEKEASRAAKTDCRANYAEMGLLAIPMLARDALSQSGCRW